MARLKKWLNWSNEAYLRGLPEMDRFPDDTAREQALREIGRGFYTWAIVPVLMVHAVGVWIGFFALTYAVRRMFPPLQPHAGLIAMVVVLAAYTAYITLALRRDLARDLRRRLHGLGVPICTRCGYDLRGAHTPATPCPECGTVPPPAG